MCRLKYEYSGLSVYNFNIGFLIHYVLPKAHGSFQISFLLPIPLLTALRLSLMSQKMNISLEDYSTYDFTE